MKRLRILIITGILLVLFSSVAYAFTMPSQFFGGLSGTMTRPAGYQAYPISLFNTPYSFNTLFSPISSPALLSDPGPGDLVTADTSSQGQILPPDNVGGAKIISGPSNWDYYKNLPANKASICLYPPAPWA
jgi:hypothetical protein